MIFKLNFLFLLFSIQNCLIISNGQECKADSFDILINDKDINIEYEKVKLDYQIKLKPGVTNMNESEYTLKCLKHVIFEYKSIDESGFLSKDFKYERLKSSAFFDDLKYLSNYTFNIKYVQTNGRIYNAQTLTNINTCFGQPSELTDFKLDENDGKVYISWNKPLQINAPNVCSYHIFVIDHDKNQLNKLVQEENKFIYTGSRKNTEILVSAYNEDRCYKDKFAFVDKCVHKQAYGPYMKAILKQESTTSSSTAPTTTQKQTSQATSSKPTDKTTKAQSGNKSYVLKSNTNKILYCLILTFLVNFL